MKSISAKILELLIDNRPRTSLQVAEKLGMRPSTVTDSLSDLYSRKKVYICAWTKNKNVTVRVYKIGNDFDAPRPDTKRKHNPVEERIRQELAAEGRIPFDENNPRCDTAASWIRSEV
jgi:DNA-binding IclR family transcriptional regulator